MVWSFYTNREHDIISGNKIKSCCDSPFKTILFVKFTVELLTL